MAERRTKTSTRKRAEIVPAVVEPATASKEPISPLLAEFGIRLREARLAIKLSQYNLAIAAGLTKSSITIIEAGRQNITFQTAERLAEAVQVPISTMLTSNGDTVRPDRRKLAIELDEGDAFAVARTAAEKLDREIPLINPMTRRVEVVVPPPKMARKP